jgi:hypothetical protein
MQPHLPLVALLSVLAGTVAAAAEQDSPSSTAPSTATPTPEATTPKPEATPTESREDTLPAGRVLNGHVFMPSAFVPGALTTTSFATYLELAYGKTSASAQIGNTLYSGSFDYAGVGAIIGYEYAFLDYFSARLSINEFVYSGINGESALVIGTSLATGGSLGFTASLPIGDTLRVGLLLDGSIGPGLALTIGSGINSIIESCQAGDCSAGRGEIFGKRNAYSVTPALAMNWAPWRPFGITANVSYTFGWQDLHSGTINGQAFGLGLAFDFDFKAISDVPIGLQFVYTWIAPTSGSSLQHVSDIGGGIFYTGRPHLALGLQIIARRFKVQPDVNVSWSTYLATIGLRYYW